MPTPEIGVDTTDDFVDLQIPILSAETIANGGMLLTVGGVLTGQRIEAQFLLKQGLQPTDFSAEEITVNALDNGVIMSLSGEPGRNFALAFADFYNLPRSSPDLPLQLRFTVVALAGVPDNVAHEVVKLKLFHETGSTDEDEGIDYFEMFFNIDIASGFIELREKDHDFRMGVLNALTREP